jgi:hypothetical protein
MESTVISDHSNQVTESIRIPDQNSWKAFQHLNKSTVISEQSGSITAPSPKAGPESVHFGPLIDDEIVSHPGLSREPLVGGAAPRDRSDLRGFARTKIFGRTWM